MMLRYNQPIGKALNVQKEGVMADEIHEKQHKALERAIRKLGSEPSVLIEILHEAQGIYGFLSISTLETIAEALMMPKSQVFGVATFYHYFRLQPKGEHTCVVCTGTACYIKGAPKILEAFEAYLGIKPGQSTKDGILSLLTSRCFGACALAPAATLDDDTKGLLKPEDIPQLIEALKEVRAS
jgi:bidirectional [NiFe] hydrogenase diaphorase subunit